MLNESIYAFGTLVSINAVCEQEEIDEAISIFENYDYISNIYDNNSELSRLNNTTGCFQCSENLYNLLNFSFSFTNDSFNIFMGKINNLWKDAITVGNLPDAELINSFGNEVYDSDIIFLDDYKVNKIGNAQIDLGSSSKGYALQIVIDYFKQQGIEKYSIDCGHSSIAVGTKNDGSSFKILINGTNEVLSLSSKSIGVSGIEEQSATIEGRIIHHIIDPLTFNPTTMYDKVVIIGDDASICDVLSTMFMSMTVEDIMDYESLYSIKTIIFKNGNMIYDGR